jgi:hypothetical protein
MSRVHSVPWDWHRGGPPAAVRLTVRIGLGLLAAMLALLALSRPAAADLFTSQEPTAPPPATPAAAAAPSPATSGVRLGAIGPLSGPRAAVGVILRVAQAVVGRSGGGEVIVKDDGSMPVRTIPAARYLENYHRVQAYLSPLETYPVASLRPYLGHTQTPTLFLATTLGAAAVGPRIVGFAPSGASTTRVLAQEAQRLAAARVQARNGLPAGQGVWVVWVENEDGRDRLAGVRQAGIPGLVEIPIAADQPVRLPDRLAPEALIVIGAPRQVGETAAAARTLRPACASGGDDATYGTAPCAPPPALFASVFEPYDWAELAGVDTVTIAEWLETDPRAGTAHQTALHQLVPGEKASRLTLWGHALGDVTAEVLRRAGANPDGVRLLAAAESLRAWQSAFLPPVTLHHDDHWPIEHVAMVTVARGKPAATRGPWLAVPRP